MRDLSRKVDLELEEAAASDVVAWAWERFGDDLALAASFQDSVLIDIVAKTAPRVEVVFLDTQYHFAETLWYVEQVQQRYNLNLRVERPVIEPDNLWESDVEKCCRLRKVEPLDRALAGKRAWMSGVRRCESPSRADAPVVGLDSARGLVKINPIATWTDLDVEGYVRDHRLLVHPLADRGYASIGCWPCTSPVEDGEHGRSGRWSGLEKTECGLHL